MSKTQKLDFAVIGAQKCATTWLYDCLKDHPELNLRNSKNEDIYYGSEWMKTNGIEKYFNQFPERSDYPKGCVSVEYIEDRNVAAMLYNHNPDLKIIVSLRKPELRAISAYQWYVRKAKIPNTHINTGIAQVLLHYKGLINNEYTNAYKNIIERGLYADRLKHWFEIFPPEQIKIQFFDEVQQNPRKSIVDIFDFLDTDTNFIPPNVATKPKKNIGFSPLIILQRQFAASTLVGKVVDKSNQFFSQKKNADVLDKIDNSIILQLKELYDAPLQDLKNSFATYHRQSLQKLETYWK